MDDTSNKLRDHYGGAGAGVTDRIRAALAALAPDDRPLTVTELAPLDQFHTRGLAATAELGAAAALTPSSRVLDLGSGVGGPARYLAATFGCRVTGVDLSPAFVEAAVYLTERCGLSGRVSFATGDALHLAFEDGAFDAVFLQHVAMNIGDRDALYAEVHRVLAPGGRFATYDLVLRGGDVVYPVPWARDASTSFLRTEAETRAALERAGFTATLWRDDNGAAIAWSANAVPAQAPGGPNLGVVMGPDFGLLARNLAQNVREDRLGVLAAVLRRG